MNAGRFYIDGTDAYEKFRVFLEEGSFASLLQYPSLKKVDSTDWPEEDGEEVDLTEPRLDTRTVTLKFVSHDRDRRFGEYGGFISMLSDMGYHEFVFPALSRTYKLRLTTQNAMEHLTRADFFSLQFADDFPPCSEGYTRTNSHNSLVRKYDDYELDGLPLTDYGVRVLQGSLAEVLKSPEVKAGLLTNGGKVNGAKYHDGERAATFKSKEVKLECLMRAATFGEFWSCYEALLYDLARPDGKLEWNGDEKDDVELPGKRLLYVDATGEEYPCYYKGCSSKDFAFTEGKIWWEFTLTLVFTSFRVGADEFLLAAENGSFIVTEGYDESRCDCIDMQTI